MYYCNTYIFDIFVFYNSMQSTAATSPPRISEEHKSFILNYDNESVKVVRYKMSI